MRVDEDNGNAVVMLNRWYQKFGGFKAMHFGIILVVSFHILPLVLGVEAMLEERGTKDKCKEEEEVLK